MILVQIATALAIGTYVVLSKDAPLEFPAATPRESFQFPSDHLDRAGRQNRKSLICRVRRFLGIFRLEPRPICNRWNRSKLRPKDDSCHTF